MLTIIGKRVVFSFPEPTLSPRNNSFGIQTPAVFDNVDSMVFQIVLPSDHHGQSWMLWCTAVIFDEVFYGIGVLDNVDFSMNFINGLYYSMMKVTQECSKEINMVSTLDLVQ